MLGVLVHELGHSLGIWHSGDDDWSFDGETPTMVAATSASLSKDAETISQDDRGSAQWVDFINLGIGRFFSDDPSFEGTFPGNWGRIEPTNLSVSNAPLNGDHSLLIESDWAGVFITSVLDPWKENTDPLHAMPGMDPGGDGRHRIQAYTKFHETATGDDIEAGYQYAYIPYDPAGAKVGAVGNFSSYVTVVCEGQAGGWEACKKAKVFDLDADPTTEGTVAFRGLRIKWTKHNDFHLRFLNDPFTSVASQVMVDVNAGKAHRWR
jgi:hypothetical protein